MSDEKVESAAEIARRFLPCSMPYCATEDHACCPMIARERLAAAIEAAVAREQDRAAVFENAYRALMDKHEQVARELEAREADLAKEREMLEEGHRLLGSFFEALKPLNLQMINVQDPGSHVTNLIVERDIAEAEVVRLKEAAIQAQCAADRNAMTLRMIGNCVGVTWQGEADDDALWTAVKAIAK